jgi:hypothetical protein
VSAATYVVVSHAYFGSPATSDELPRDALGEITRENPHLADIEHGVQKPEW